MPISSTGIRLSGGGTIVMAAALALVASSEATAQETSRGYEAFTRLECSRCHGDRAQGDMGPTLAATRLPLERVREQVRSPRTRRMPAFTPEELPDDELEAVYAYLRALPPPSLAQKPTWWAINALNLPTPALPPRGEFQVHFSHRFSDSVQDAGFERLYGLDSFAFPGFGFTYGLHPRVAPYVSRTANLSTWEYGVKVALLREGDLGVPLSAAVNVGGSALDASGVPNASRFVVELPIGARLHDRLALQVIPFYTTNPDELGNPDSPGYSFAIGVGGSVRLSTRLSLDGEWIANVSGFRREGAMDQWQAGVSIQAGKHLFQLLVTNSVLTTPDFMAAGTLRTGIDSDIRLGFNLVRGFSF